MTVDVLWVGGSVFFKGVAHGRSLNWTLDYFLIKENVKLGGDGRFGEIEGGVGMRL